MRTIGNNSIRLFVAAVFFAATAGAGSAQTPAGYYVLAVGVGQYKHKGINPVPCASDARKVEALFKRPDMTARTQLLTNAEATVEGIKTALRGVKDRVKPGEMVVLFLAGHGTPDNDGKEWLFLPHDYDPANAAETVVRDTDLLEAADDLAAHGHQVLLAIESCHSGMLIVRAFNDGLVGNRRDPKKGRGGLVIAVSSKPSEVSYVSALGADGVSGWFSTALREGLTGQADADCNGVVTLRELREFLEARLYVIAHTRFKLAGLDWQSQESICLGSPEAADGMGLMRAAVKGRPAQQVKDEEFVPFSPDILNEARTALTVVGTWKLVRCTAQEIGVDGKPKDIEIPLPLVYTLTLRDDGTYTARLTDAKGKVKEETTGTYKYEPKGEFSLSYKGHKDLLMYMGHGEGWMTLRVQCAPFFQDDVFYRLERVKE